MDSELLEPSINGDPLLTAQDAEMDARGLHHAENSSDEGLLEPKKKKKKEKAPFCYGCRRWCGWIVSRERRRITLHG